tara:strand:+ start:182 stop:580 length:399 start_codon:yes stop_codon:yes gene_type:complete
MGYFEKSLSSDEQVVLKFKVHWIVWLKILFYLFPLGILLIPIFYSIKLLFIVLGLEQGLTNKRVIKKVGLISRNTDEMRLNKIETSEVKQSILGRIFGYGNIRVSGTGISDVVLEYVPNPIKAKQKLDSHLS